MCDDPRQTFRNFIIGILAAMLVACGHPPPEQALRETVKDLQAAIEQRDTAELRNALANDFIGPDALDRDGAKRLAQGLFLRNREIRVALGPLEVTVQGEHATVHCTAALTGGSGGMLPDKGSLYDVTTGWRLEGDDWRLTSIEWESP